MILRNVKENAIKILLLICATSSIGIVFFFVATMVYEGFPIIAQWFLYGFGMVWDRSSDRFGIIPYIFSTIYVGVGATLLAAALGIPTAIYLAEFANTRLRNLIKPSLEMLTGLPSVVVGLFGFVLIVTFATRYLGSGLGVLSAWLVLAIMSLPHIASISEDSIRAVPHSYREAALALGATKWQTTLRVLLPSAKSGIAASVILALGAAVGETMAVFMVIGGRMTPAITLDPRVTSNVLTVIPALDYGDMGHSGPLWQAIFAVSFVLFVIVAALNLVTAKIVKGGKKAEGP